MKRIYKLISFVTVAALLAASCEKDEIERVLPEQYNFAAISQEELVVNEPYPEKGAEIEEGKVYETIVEIPVMVASVNPVETIVSYEILSGDKDNNAVLGEDFELIDPSATLVFNSGMREAKIQVKVKGCPGVYTGDKKFTVKLVSGGSVGLGVEKTCIVKISDLDHPLADILGDYTAKGIDGLAESPASWALSLEKDPKDVTVVWIDAILPFHTLNAGLPWGVYAKVSEDHKTLSIPLGQQFKPKAGGGKYPLFLFEFLESGLSKEGEIKLTSEDGKTFSTEQIYGMLAIVENEKTAIDYGTVIANLSITKK